MRSAILHPSKASLIKVFRKSFKKWKQKLLNYIPNKTSKKIQEVIDGIPQVVSSKNVVEMNLDICKVRPKVHLRDLQVPVLVDDDGRLGVDVELVDLKPHGTITIQGEDADYEACQVVHGIAPQYRNS